jgi:hypothetical protein
MTSSDFKFHQKLKKQMDNSQQPGINYFLGWLYSEAEKEFQSKTRILEIGSGAGISKLFFNRIEVLRTDLLEFQDNGVIGSINCSKLPYGEDSFEAAFGMDVLHHLAHPIGALAELKRVINWQEGSAIVLVEPYVSLFSATPYKLFHEEKTTLFTFRFQKGQFANESPEDGDQSIPRWLFESPKGQSLLNVVFPPTHFDIQTKHICWLSFFLTGGLTKPSKVSKAFIRTAINFEAKFPKRLMRLLASRVIITIKPKRIPVC